MSLFPGRLVVLFLLLGCGLVGAIAQTVAPSAKGTLWTPVPLKPALGGSPFSSITLAPERFAQFFLDEESMRTSLAAAPVAQQPGSARSLLKLVLPVPLPDGSMVTLAVEETDIMEPALAVQFPSIKVYNLRSVEPSGLAGSADFTEQGFHAMFSTPQGTVFVDPRTDSTGIRTYISYFKQDYRPADKDLGSMVRHPPVLVDAQGVPSLTTAQSAANNAAARSGSQLTTYRLALAATGEYTAFQGGTIPLALSAMTTTINRVNTVYQRDLAIKMVLVANTSSLIYINSATDPYTNSNGSTMLGQNQTNLTNVIGSANYDIGHVFSTGGGGIAGLGVTCRSTSKAQGVTGSSSPVGDPFDIDYVAHEMGHQFGGNHTFNGTTGACGGGNRNASTAYEPGSGTTVMAYAGICGGEDLQPHSDSLFHAGSITEIINYTTSGSGSTCGTRSAMSNTAPVAAAGPDYTIPANTPFMLVGSATDVNSGDTLTYAWDQMNVGTASTTADMADEGTRALFRSFDPSSSGTRSLPKLASLLAGTSDIGERLPTTNRNLTFRLTVRDQAGGVHDDDAVITVTTTAGPFRVTAPNGGESLGTSTTVTWNVANTSVAPVSCSSVNISLSTDGGLTQLGTLLATNVPNTGSAIVTFPVGSSSSARLRVQCANNIFFDVSDANFSYARAVLLDQTITFGPAPSVRVGTTGTVTATASSGLPVTLSLVPGSTCTLNAGVVTGVSAGLCSITGDQAGNASYNPAPQALLSFSITASLTTPDAPTILSMTAGPGRVTVTLGAPSNTGGGPIVSYSVTCTAAGLPATTATSSGLTVVVTGLKPGVPYACTATASNGTYSSTSTAAASATATPIDMTPILMLLLD